MIAIIPLFSQYGSNPSVQNEIVSQSNIEMESLEKILYLPSYEIHDRISISDDLDWEEQGIPGAGTEENPYVIENLEISVSYDCIYIVYTSKFYVIRNCFLRTESSHRDGIHINNADHGRIEDCIIESAEYGISVLQTNGLVITNNTISDCDLYGIRLSTTSNCNVSHNRIHDTISSGIYCSSSNNIIENNTVWNSSSGLYMSSCSFSEIQQNNFWNSSTGAYLDSCNAVTISNNTFHDNFEIGFRNYDSDNLIFENNTIYNNTGYGVHWNRGDGALVNQNYISDNALFGFYLYYARNCTISNNVFQNDGLALSGADILDYEHTVTGNLANGKTLGYFFNSNDMAVNGNSYGQILAVNCTRLAIQGGTISQTDTGIAFHYCNNSTVNSTSISNQLRGVYLYVSNFCNVTTTTMENCGVYVSGHYANNWVHNFAETTVNGKPLGYFYEAADLTLDDNSLGQIIVVNSTRIDIKNYEINSASMGLALAYSTECSVTETVLSYNYIGLRLQECSNFEFENNTIHNSTSSAFLSYYSNTGTLKNVTILDSGYGFYLYSCTDFKVNNSVISSNEYGAYLRSSTKLNFSHCTFDSNYQAFYTYYFDNSTIYDCDILSSVYIGIRLFYSDQITILDGTIANNGNHGIYCMSSTHGEIIGNTVVNNQADGISLFYGDYYQIVNNTVEGNSAYGINLYVFSDYNIVFGNNLSANLEGNGYAYQDTNTWDNSVSIGNYWDDYQGPSTYSIPGPGNNVDRYPRGPAVVLPDHDDESFQFESSGASFTWASFSTESDYYIVFLEDTVYDEGIWDGLGITVDVDTLSLGTFNYTLFVNGTSGYSSNDTVWVTIYDNPPTIDSPSDRGYNFDTIGHTLSWGMADANPFGYYLYINDNLESWGAWTGASPVISIDGLSIGTYNYTMMVNDTSGNSASDTVIVTVWDTEPFLESPYGNIVYDEGTTGNTIYWNASDFNPANYTVYKNSSIDAFYPWDGQPITYSVDGLLVGVYNYTIVIVDTSGQTAYNTVFVTVQEASTTTIVTTTTSSISNSTTTTTSSGSGTPTDSALVLTISIASVAIILIVIILIFKKKS